MLKYYKHYKCGQWSWISKYFDAYFNGCLPIRKDRTEEYPLGWDLDHLLRPLNLTSKQKWNILVSRSLRPVLSQDHNTLSDVARNTVHFGVCSIRKAGASPLSLVSKLIPGLVRRMAADLWYGNQVTALNTSPISQTPLYPSKKFWL